jgi:hypothetical protein
LMASSPAFCFDLVLASFLFLLAELFYDGISAALLDELSSGSIKLFFSMCLFF